MYVYEVNIYILYKDRAELYLSKRYKSPILFKVKKYSQQKIKKGILAVKYIDIIEPECYNDLSNERPKPKRVIKSRSKKSSNKATSTRSL